MQCDIIAAASNRYFLFKMASYFMLAKDLHGSVVYHFKCPGCNADYMGDTDEDSIVLCVNI